jgi:ABC-type lipoprotein export system ATPase subunit
MTEALKRIIEEIEQLDTATQDEIAELLRQELKHRRTKAAIAHQNTEWAASLQEIIKRIDRGEQVGPVHLSEEEFFAALDAIPYRGKEQGS